jgi:hypothetical protein
MSFYKYLKYKTKYHNLLESLPVTGERAALDTGDMVLVNGTDHSPELPDGIVGQKGKVLYVRPNEMVGIMNEKFGKKNILGEHVMEVHVDDLLKLESVSKLVDSAEIRVEVTYQGTEGDHKNYIVMITQLPESHELYCHFLDPCHFKIAYYPPKNDSESGTAKITKSPSFGILCYHACKISSRTFRKYSKFNEIVVRKVKQEFEAVIGKSVIWD